MRRFRQFFIPVVLAFVLVCLPSFSQAASWSIYVYMCGSDLESDDESASIDIDDMLKARLPEDATIVIEAGGAKKWHGHGIRNNRLNRLIIRGGKIEKRETLPQASMGQKETFASFLSWSSRAYPAERKALIFWNHGGGSVDGVCSDENFDDESLLLDDISEALETVFGKPGSVPVFDLIGFDACLMASIETAVACQGYGKVMVASQESVPGCGWGYSNWLNILGRNTSIPADRLAISICNGFLDTCRNEEEDTKKVTLSAIDLTKVAGLKRSYDMVGIEAMKRVSQDSTFLSRYRRCAKQAENYKASRDIREHSDMMDIGSFIRRMKADLPETADGLLASLQESVIYQVHGRARNPSGLSCYYPYDGDEDSFDYMVDFTKPTTLLVFHGFVGKFISKSEAEKQISRISKGLEPEW